MNIEQQKQYHKNLELEHNERKEYRKRWCIDRLKKVKEYTKKYHMAYCTAQKEERKEYKKQWYKNNPEYGKQYYATPTGKEIKKRAIAKRRELGFKPVNEWFEGCAGHHYDKDRVIHIPKPLHESVWHCLETGKNMEEINRLAIDYLWIEMWDKIGEPELLKEAGGSLY